MDFGEVKIRVWVLWYSNPNMSPALAPSLVSSLVALLSGFAPLRWGEAGFPKNPFWIWEIKITKPTHEGAHARPRDACLLEMHACKMHAGTHH
jgi:hypothetical protein